MRNRHAILPFNSRNVNMTCRESSKFTGSYSKVLVKVFQHSFVRKISNTMSFPLEHLQMASSKSNKKETHLHEKKCSGKDQNIDYFTVI